MKFLSRAVLVVFVINISSSYRIEAAIWEDRRKSIEVASLPANFLPAISKSSIISPQPFLGISSQSQSSKVINELRLNGRHFGTFCNLPAELLANVNLRDSYQGHSGSTVVLLEDIHLNKEAQTHLSQAIKSFGDVPGNAPVLVGLEGGEGDLHYDEWKTDSDRELSTAVADSFFETGDISGPAHAGFTSYKKDGTRGLNFEGVDNMALHAANVQAYKDSKALKPQVSKEIAQLNKEIETEKKKVFSPQLLAFDKQVQAYRLGKLSLAEYVKSLSEFLPMSRNGEARWGMNGNSTLGNSHLYPTPPSPLQGVGRNTENKQDVGRNSSEESLSLNIQTFLEAYAMEKSFDFDRIENQRREILEKLVKTLSEKDLNDLVQVSMAYQQGIVTFAGYYQHLKDVCSSHKIELRTVPQFNRYIQYVLLTDGIKTEQLFNEITQLEKSVYSELSTQNPERSLISSDRQLYLTSQLVEFALTSDQWKEYAEFKNKDQRSNPSIAEDELKPFIDFYSIADRRSEAMVHKLFDIDGFAIGSSILKKTNQLAVLVAGGFHTEGLTRRLREQNISYVVASPKITKVEEGEDTHYLSVFDREKTPLEKIFAGEKLFLVAPIVGGNTPDEKLVRNAASQALRQPTQTIKIDYVSANDGFKTEVFARVGNEPRPPFWSLIIPSLSKPIRKVTKAQTVIYTRETANWLSLVLFRLRSWRRNLPHSGWGIYFSNASFDLLEFFGLKKGIDQGGNAIIRSKVEATSIPLNPEVVKVLLKDGAAGDIDETNKWFLKKFLDPHLGQRLRQIEIGTPSRYLSDDHLIMKDLVTGDQYQVGFLVNLDKKSISFWVSGKQESIDSQILAAFEEFLTLDTQKDSFVSGLDLKSLAVLAIIGMAAGAIILGAFNFAHFLRPWAADHVASLFSGRSTLKLLVGVLAAGIGFGVVGGWGPREESDEFRQLQLKFNGTKPLSAPKAKYVAFENPKDSVLAMMIEAAHLIGKTVPDLADPKLLVQAVNAFNVKVGGMAELLLGRDERETSPKAIPILRNVSDEDARRLLLSYARGERTSILSAGGRATRLGMPKEFDLLGLSGQTKAILKALHQRGYDDPKKKIVMDEELQLLVQRAAAGTIESADDLSILQRDILQMKDDVKVGLKKFPDLGLTVNQVLSRLSVAITVNTSNRKAIERQVRALTLPITYYEIEQNEEGAFLTPDAHGLLHWDESDLFPEGHERPLELAVTGDSRIGQVYRINPNGSSEKISRTWVDEMESAGTKYYMFAQTNDLWLLTDGLALTRWNVVQPQFAEGVQFVMEMLDNTVLRQKGGGARSPPGLQKAILRDSLALTHPDLEKFAYPDSLSRMFYLGTIAGLKKINWEQVPWYLNYRDKLTPKRVSREKYSGDISSELESRIMIEDGAKMNTYKIRDRIPAALEMMAQQDQNESFKSVVAEIPSLRSGAEVEGLKVEVAAGSPQVKEFPESLRQVLVDYAQSHPWGVGLSFLSLVGFLSILVGHVDFPALTHLLGGTGGAAVASLFLIPIRQHVTHQSMIFESEMDKDFADELHRLNLREKQIARFNEAAGYALLSREPFRDVVTGKSPVAKMVLQQVGEIPLADVALSGNFSLKTVTLKVRAMGQHVSEYLAHQYFDLIKNRGLIRRDTIMRVQTDVLNNHDLDLSPSEIERTENGGYAWYLLSDPHLLRPFENSEGHVDLGELLDQTGQIPLDLQILNKSRSFTSLIDSDIELFDSTHHFSGFIFGKVDGQNSILRIFVSAKNFHDAQRYFEAFGSRFPAALRVLENQKLARFAAVSSTRPGLLSKFYSKPLSGNHQLNAGRTVEFLLPILFFTGLTALALPVLFPNAHVGIGGFVAIAIGIDAAIVAYSWLRQKVASRRWSEVESQRIKSFKRNAIHIRVVVKHFPEDFLERQSEISSRIRNAIGRSDLRNKVYAFVGYGALSVFRSPFENQRPITDQIGLVTINGKRNRLDVWLKSSSPEDQDLAAQSLQMLLTKEVFGEKFSVVADDKISGSSQRKVEAENPVSKISFGILFLGLGFAGIIAGLSGLLSLGASSLFALRSSGIATDHAMLGIMPPSSVLPILAVLLAVMSVGMVVRVAGGRSYTFESRPVMLETTFDPILVDVARLALVAGIGVTPQDYVQTTLDRFVQHANEKKNVEGKSDLLRSGPMAVIYPLKSGVEVKIQFQVTKETPSLVFVVTGPSERLNEFLARRWYTRLSDILDSTVQVKVAPKTKLSKINGPSIHLIPFLSLMGVGAALLGLIPSAAKSPSNATVRATSVDEGRQSSLQTQEIRQAGLSIKKSSRETGVVLDEMLVPAAALGVLMLTVTLGLAFGWTAHAKVVALACSMVLISWRLFRRVEKSAGALVAKSSDVYTVVSTNRNWDPLRVGMSRLEPAGHSFSSKIIQHAQLGSLSLHDLINEVERSNLKLQGDRPLVKPSDLWRVSLRFVDSEKSSEWIELDVHRETVTNQVSILITGNNSILVNTIHTHLVTVLNYHSPETPNFRGKAKAGFRSVLRGIFDKPKSSIWLFTLLTAGLGVGTIFLIHALRLPTVTQLMALGGVAFSIGAVFMIRPYPIGYHTKLVPPQIEEATAEEVSEHLRTSDKFPVQAENEKPLAPGRLPRRLMNVLKAYARDFFFPYSNDSSYVVRVPVAPPLPIDNKETATPSALAITTKSKEVFRTSTELQQIDTARLHHVLQKWGSVDNYIQEVIDASVQQTNKEFSARYGRLAPKFRSVSHRLSVTEQTNGGGAIDSRFQFNGVALSIEIVGPTPEYNVKTIEQWASRFTELFSPEANPYLSPQLKTKSVPTYRTVTSAIALDPDSVARVVQNWGSLQDFVQASIEYAVGENHTALAARFGLKAEKYFSKSRALGVTEQTADNGPVEVDFRIDDSRLVIEVVGPLPEFNEVTAQQWAGNFAQLFTQPSESKSAKERFSAALPILIGTIAGAITYGLVTQLGNPSFNVGPLAASFGSALFAGLGVGGGVFGALKGRSPTSDGARVTVYRVFDDSGLEHTALAFELTKKYLFIPGDHTSTNLNLFDLMQKMDQWDRNELKPDEINQLTHRLKFCVLGQMSQEKLSAGRILPTVVLTGINEGLFDRELEFLKEENAGRSYDFLKSHHIIDGGPLEHRNKLHRSANDLFQDLYVQQILLGLLTYIFNRALIFNLGTSGSHWFLSPKHSPTATTHSRTHGVSVSPEKRLLYVTPQLEAVRLGQEKDSFTTLKSKVGILFKRNSPVTLTHVYNPRIFVATISGLLDALVSSLKEVDKENRLKPVNTVKSVKENLAAHLSQFSMTIPWDRTHEAGTANLRHWFELVRMKKNLSGETTKRFEDRVDQQNALVLILIWRHIFFDESLPANFELLSPGLEEAIRKANGVVKDIRHSTGRQVATTLLVERELKDDTLEKSGDRSKILLEAFEFMLEAKEFLEKNFSTDFLIKSQRSLLPKTGSMLARLAGLSRTAKKEFSAMLEELSLKEIRDRVRYLALPESERFLRKFRIHLLFLVGVAWFVLRGQHSWLTHSSVLECGLFCLYAPDVALKMVKNLGAVARSAVNEPLKFSQWIGACFRDEIRNLFRNPILIETNGPDGKKTTLRIVRDPHLLNHSIFLIIYQGQDTLLGEGLIKGSIYDPVATIQVSLSDSVSKQWKPIIVQALNQALVRESLIHIASESKADFAIRLNQSFLKKSDGKPLQAISTELMRRLLFSTQSWQPTEFQLEEYNHLTWIRLFRRHNNQRESVGFVVLNLDPIDENIDSDEKILRVQIFPAENESISVPLLTEFILNALLEDGSLNLVDVEHDFDREAWPIGGRNLAPVNPFKSNTAPDKFAVRSLSTYQDLKRSFRFSTPTPEWKLNKGQVEVTFRFRVPREVLTGTDIFVTWGLPNTSWNRGIVERPTEPIANGEYEVQFTIPSKAVDGLEITCFAAPVETVGKDSYENIRVHMGPDFGVNGVVHLPKENNFSEAANPAASVTEKSQDSQGSSGLSTTISALAVVGFLGYFLVRSGFLGTVVAGIVNVTQLLIQHPKVVLSAIATLGLVAIAAPGGAYQDPEVKRSKKFGPTSAQRVREILDPNLPEKGMVEALFQLVPTEHLLGELTANDVRRRDFSMASLSIRRHVGGDYEKFYTALLADYLTNFNLLRPSPFDLALPASDENSSIVTGFCVGEPEKGNSPFRDWAALNSLIDRVIEQNRNNIVHDLVIPVFTETIDHDHMSRLRKRVEHIPSIQIVPIGPDDTDLMEDGFYSWAKILGRAVKLSGQLNAVKKLLADSPDSQFITYTRDPGRWVLGSKALAKFWWVMANLGFGWMAFRAADFDTRLRGEEQAREAA